MKKKDQYFIGDMSRICNISKKTLRYYDQINLISSHREDFNNYRFYTEESILAVPVVKYYKQMGFTLDEMKEFIEGNRSNVFQSIKKSFRAKLQELEEKQEEIRRKHVSVKDWYDLIHEAETVIENAIREVSVKFVEPCDILCMDQVFENNIKSSIINLEFTKYVEDLNNEITGPVIINYSSFKDRLENRKQPVRILQRTIMPCPAENQYHFGGHLMLSCYHIGPHEDIHSTYQRMEEWAREHGYELGKESFERYVTDYWTTRNTAKFVTEILIRACRPGAAV